MHTLQKLRRETSSIPAPSTPSAVTITQTHVVNKPLTMVMDCPSSDGKEYRTFFGEVFRKHCGVDWPAGEVAADRSGVVWDLMTVKTFTFNTCIDACSTYNNEMPAHKCVGVSWGVTTGYLGNCWLKANVGLDQPRMVDQRSSATLIER